MQNLSFLNHWQLFTWSRNSCLYGNWKFITMFTEAHHWTLSWGSSIQVVLAQLICPIVILPSTPVISSLEVFKPNICIYRQCFSMHTGKQFACRQTCQKSKTACAPAYCTFWSWGWKLSVRILANMPKKDTVHGYFRFPAYAKYSTPLTLLYFIALTTLGEKWISWGFSLCNYFHSSVLSQVQMFSSWLHFQTSSIYVPPTQWRTFVYTHMKNNMQS